MIMIFIFFKMLRFACWDYYDKLKNEIYSIFIITKERVTSGKLAILFHNLHINTRVINVTTVNKFRDK